MAKTRAATARPAMMPSSLPPILPRQVMSGGMTASVVTSPAPMSSASADSMSASSVSGASDSVMGSSVAVKSVPSLFLHDENAMPDVTGGREVAADVGPAALLAEERRSAHQGSGGSGLMQPDAVERSARRRG